MIEQALIYFAIYISCMFKTIFGPLMGYAAGINPFITSLLTIAGMMTTICIFAYFNKSLRQLTFIKYFKFKKIFSPKSRQFVKIWNKYGLIGISFMTPILLSPLGGAILAVSFGSPRKKMIIYMFIFSVFWSFIVTYGVYYSGDTIQKIFK